MMKKRLCRGLLVLLSMLLASCGGGAEFTSFGDDGQGDGDRPTGFVSQRDLGGIWNGTFTSTKGNVSDVNGFVSDLGEVLLAYQDGNSITQVIDGNLSLTSTNSTEERNVSGTLKGTSLTGLPYINSRTTITTQVAGTVKAKDMLILNESYNDQNYGQYSLNYERGYEDPSSLLLVAGYYTSYEGSLMTTYNIDTAGNLSGSTSGGCTFSGSVRIINSSYNLYRMQNNITNCGNFNGQWDGFATLTGSLNQRNTLNIFLKGEDDVIRDSVSR